MTRSIVLGASCLALLAGCGVFTANNRENIRAQQAIMMGDAPAALKALEKRSDLPGRLDRAVILADMGQLEESNREFDGALGLITEYERRALVSAQEAGRGAGSLLINDKVLEYQGEGYEKVMLHAYKARNYLLLGDQEAARVEIRNANLRQEEEMKRHQAAIDAAAKDQQKTAINVSAMSSNIDSQFASQEAILKRVTNVYQNPFATYLSGYVYEANGEPGDAFVDYKNAYRFVSAPVVGNEVVRLAQKLGRNDEAKGLGLTVPRGKPVDAGDTLVIIDNGFAPQRRELKFPIPTPHTVLFAAVPLTQPIPTDLEDVEILDADGQSLGRTSMLVDVEAMSVRDLHDRYPGILVRQFVRLAAKEAAAFAAQEAAKKDATAALIVGIGTTVMNAVSEQADLRSWYALPRSMHVARVRTRPDATSVTLRLLGPGGAPMREMAVPIVTRGKERMVVARYVAGRLLAQGGAPTATNQTAAAR